MIKESCLIKRYMEEALEEAKIALKENEVPVGAVIVDENGVIIGRGHNTRENSREIHGHAEINAINNAAGNLGSLKLSGCSLFVTLEPCPMCTGAVIASGIDVVYFGADSPDSGAMGGKINILPERIDCYGGIMSEECGKLVTDLFREKR